MRRQRRRRVDVRVAMDRAVAQELRVLEPGDHAGRRAAAPGCAAASGSRRGSTCARRDPPCGAARRRTASRPVRGSRRPTGFIGPKRSVSRPRRAISSTGMQPSKYGTSSNSCAVILVGGDQRVEERLVLLARDIGQLRYAPSSPAPVHRLLAVARRAKHDRVVDRFARRRSARSRRRRRATRRRAARESRRRARRR